MANVAVSNTFTSGTTIVAAQVNTNFSDLVNYINNRNGGGTKWDALASASTLVVDGDSTLTGNATVGGTLGVTGTLSFSGLLSCAAGSVSAPSITFTGDTNTGIYRAGADIIALGAGGVSVLEVSYDGATRLISGGNTLLNFADGTAAAPTYAFGNDPDCGMYRIGANNIGLAVNGTKQVDISTSGMTLTNALPVASGGTGQTTKIISTGTYTGNGGTQNIAHGLGAEPSIVIISDNTANSNIPQIYITGMGTSSHDFNGTRQTNAITAVSSTNISLGANNSVNQNTVTYSFIAMKAQ